MSVPLTPETAIAIWGMMTRGGAWEREIQSGLEALGYALVNVGGFDKWYSPSQLVNIPRCRHCGELYEQSETPRFCEPYYVALAENNPEHEPV